MDRLWQQAFDDASSCLTGQINEHIRDIDLKNTAFIHYL